MHLVDRLREHARQQADATAFVFLERGEREAGRLTYGQLDLRARAISARVQHLQANRAPVLIALPSGLEFIEAFFGCMYAGAIAVPAPELETRRSVDRSIAICGDAEPRLVLTGQSRRSLGH